MTFRLEQRALAAVGEISMPSSSITQSAPSGGDLVDRHPDQLLRGDRGGGLGDRAALAVEAQVGDRARPSTPDVHAQLVAAERVVVVRTRGRAARARRSSAGACSGRGCSRGRGRPWLRAEAPQREDLAARRARRPARRRRRRRCRRRSDARAVAATPRPRISGWAQWWPARTQTPSRSSTSAMSCGWMPSSGTRPRRRARRRRRAVDREARAPRRARSSA